MTTTNAETPLVTWLSAEQDGTPPRRSAHAVRPGAFPSGSIARVIAPGLGRFSPQINFAAEDGTGSGAAGADGAGAGSDAGAGAADAGAGADKGAGAAETLQRPEGIPDQFWDDKAGVKFADLGQTLNDLTAFKAAQDSRAAAVPEKADGYELKLPADLTFADGEGFELNPDDPMVAFGREVAHSVGLDQAGFEKLVGMYAQREIANAKEIQGLVAKQIEALGPNGAVRQGAVKTFLAAKLGPDAPTIFEPVLMLKNGVELMERLMRIGSGGGMSGFSQGGRDVGQSKAVDGWSEMSPAEKMAAARRR